jgi:cytochrome P450
MSSLATSRSDDLLNFDSDAFLSDPWPVYEHLRNEDPVFWSERSGAFFVSKYDHVLSALSDRRVTSAFALRISRRLFGRTILDSDGAAHRDLRKVFAPLFSASGVQRLRGEILIPAVDAVLESISARQDLGMTAEVDFMEEVAVAVPYAMITRLMGIPSEDAAWLRSRVSALSGAVEFPSTPLDFALKAKSELDDYLQQALARRREDGPMTLLDLLCPPGESIDPSALSTAVLFLAAGTETSVAAIGKIMYAILVHGIELSALSDDDYRARVIRETLRWEPPSHTLVRYAAKDLTIGGTAVPRRSAILLSLASANRDPDAFADPDNWLPDRSERRILSFSAGPHSCVGMQLALAEFDVLYQRLSARYRAARPCDPLTGIRPGLWRIRERGHIFRRPESLRICLQTA